MSIQLPSQIRNDYWVHAENSRPPHDWTDRSGKWLLFVSFKRLDETWKVVAEETAAGRLGIAAKAATGKKNPLSKNSWIKVICIYTYDSQDLDDVRRVRQRLRELGFVKKLSYKTDTATQQGIYSHISNEKVSMLWE